MKSRWIMIVLVLAALGSVAICAWIEILNRRAGGFLPRELSEHESPKWRVLASPERFLTEMYERVYRSEHALPIEAPLPTEVVADITARVRREAPRHRANARLCDALGTWGLLQYPLSVAVLLFGLAAGCWWKGMRERGTGFVCAAVGLACLCIAVYRGYFTSLGW
ncbi:MAG: hypothetical protein ABIG44_19745 [Planctomycetota bacterium]